MVGDNRIGGLHADGWVGSVVLHVENYLVPVDAVVLGRIQDTHRAGEETLEQSSERRVLTG